MSCSSVKILLQLLVKLDIAAAIPLQCEYQILVQLLEIYNEQLRDLLDESRTHKRLDIRNTERSGLNVPDAIQVLIGSWAVSVLSLGDKQVQ